MGITFLPSSLGCEAASWALSFSASLGGTFIWSDQAGLCGKALMTFQQGVRG